MQRGRLSSVWTLSALARPFDDDQTERAAYLNFDEGAQRLFSRWLGGLERRLRGDDLPPYLREHFSKYGGLVPSLALLNHLADSGTGDVGERALSRAIAFVGYLETHARRAYGAGAQSDVVAAKAILRRIERARSGRGFHRTRRRTAPHGPASTRRECRQRSKY